jgi:hypothetical protein
MFTAKNMRAHAIIRIAVSARRPERTEAFSWARLAAPCEGARNGSLTDHEQGGKTKETASTANTARACEGDQRPPTPHPVSRPGLWGGGGGGGGSTRSSRAGCSPTS